MVNFNFKSFLRVYYSTAFLDRVKLDNFVAEEMVEIVEMYEYAKQRYEQDYNPDELMNIKKYVNESIQWMQKRMAG